jgi:hypothetical protein
MQSTLADAMAALGGDPASTPRTYSWLQQRASYGALTNLPPAAFRSVLTPQLDSGPDGNPNIEALQLSPLLQADDDFFGKVLAGALDLACGLIADPTPPFTLYRANLNHITAAGSPFAG